MRWLRPECQNPLLKGATTLPLQTEIDAGEEESETTAVVAAESLKPLPWPKDAVEQVRAVANVLAASPAPRSLEQIAARFSGRGPWKKRLPSLLEMLVVPGRATLREDLYSAT